MSEPSPATAASRDRQTPHPNSKGFAMTPSWKLSTLCLGALPCALVAVSTVPARATPVTFAQYVQQDGTQQQWSISTVGTTTTVSATGAVYFTFSGISGLPFSGPESANFTLSATTNVPGNCGIACGPGDSFVQQGYSGTFSIIDSGVAPGTNLLSGTFAVTGDPSTTGAQFSSAIGSSGGSNNASATLGNLNQLVMTSAYGSFVGATKENASWSLSSLIPNFATGPVTNAQAYPAPGPFHASGTGTFSSEPGPSPVPEPSAFLLFGSALLGLGFLTAVRNPAVGSRVRRFVRGLPAA